MCKARRTRHQEEVEEREAPAAGLPYRVLLVLPRSRHSHRNLRRGELGAEVAAGRRFREPVHKHLLALTKGVLDLEETPGKAWEEELLRPLQVLLLALLFLLHRPQEG